MPDWVLFIIGFVAGSVICIIYEIVSTYHRDRKTWFAPVGVAGEEVVYQCRKCGGTFTCAAVECMLYCPVCGREVEA